MKTLLYVLAILTAKLFVTASMYAQTQQWSAIYNGSPVDIMEKTVIDPSSNVFVTGERTSSGNYSTQYLAKYNSSGVFQWQRFFYGPYYNLPNNRGAYSNSAVTDASGNIYIAGKVDSAFSSYKGYIMKYNSNGDSLWGKYAGIGDTLGYVEWDAMKMDNAGNIYVAGLNNKYVTYSSSFIIAKYSSSGTLLWVKTQAPPVFRSSYSTLIRMNLDNSNNVFVSAPAQKSNGSNTTDFYTFKLNSSGSFQWESLYNGPADDQDMVSSMTLDANGDVFVEGTGTNVTQPFKEITCIKYNGSTGAQQWIYKANGSSGNGDNAAYNVAAGPNNDVYLTGSLYTPTTSGDGVLIKLNATTGIESWRKTLAGANSTPDIYSDVCVIGSGIVYAVGVTNYYSVNSTVWIKKFNAIGDSLAGATYTQPNYIMPKSIIPGYGSSIYVSGDNTQGIPAGDAWVVKYSVMTGIDPIHSSTPDKFSLSQNYPNPFNPTTKITFNLPQDSKVTMNVFDLSGKMVSSLINDRSFTSGAHEIEFNAGSLSSGTYFYQIKAGDFTETKKMILIK